MAKQVITFILEWAWRLMWCNLLWILFSIPVITIIPSTFALYSVINKLAREDEDIDILPAFIKEFKNYLFKSYPLGISLLAIGIILYFDLLILKEQTAGVMLVLRYAILILSILFIPIICYSIPVFIEYKIAWYKTFPVAFVLAMKKPVRILLVICGIVGVLLLFLLSTGIGILFVGSLIALFTTKGALSSKKSE